MNTLNQSKSKKFFGTILPVLLFVIFTLFPYYWMFVTSVKTDADIYSNPLLYWPKNFTWENYEKLFGYFDFTKYMKNSLIIAMGTTVLSLIVSTLAAYAFARFKF